MMGFWDGSGISWTICIQSAPRYRQTTTPTVQHLIAQCFTDRMPFLAPHQQCQSTEGRIRSIIYRYSASGLACDEKLMQCSTEP